MLIGNGSLQSMLIDFNKKKNFFMFYSCSKSVQILVLYLFAIQSLLYSVAIGDSIKSANTQSGAEFLKNVMGNLRKPAYTANRKIPDDRIDVEEYIPNDTPYSGQSNEIKILSKQPFNYNGPNVSDPRQSDQGVVNK